MIRRTAVRMNTKTGENEVFIEWVLTTKEVIFVASSEAVLVIIVLIGLFV
jgi:hypothetical protein